MCNKATPCPDKALHGKHIHHAAGGTARIKENTGAIILIPSGACKRMGSDDDDELRMKKHWKSANAVL